MQKAFRFGKILVTDILGVACIIAAALTGWLPGPGGIPLFILGLSLLAIHHDWAQRYIDLAKKYADRLGDLVFISNPAVQLVYDVGGLAAMAAGGYLLSKTDEFWQLPLGTFLLFIGLTFLLGNRGRWARIKARFKR